MAFIADDLICIAAPANAPALYLYQTTDAVATTSASGYFNPVTNMLRQNDLIIANDRSTPTVRMLRVSSATGAPTVTTVSQVFG